MNIPNSTPKHHVPNSTIYNMDCMDFMRTVPNNYYDLAVVDPEYGIGVNHNMGRRKGDKPSSYKPAEWDKSPVDKSTLNEIFRVSRNQIIWGANHFISSMPINSPCWLLWDKQFSSDVTFAQFEMAWTSFDTTCKKFTLSPNQQNRIHPTQKPVKLYDWIYKNYLPDGGKVLDTHLGSGSNRIAAHRAGNIEFHGTELDADYFNDSVKRFNQHISQLDAFR